MKCFMCKGIMENDSTTFMVDLNNCIIIIKNVPSQLCSQCGEVSYSYDVTVKIEKIINSLRDVVTEIAVVNYNNKVA